MATASAEPRRPDATVRRTWRTVTPLLIPPVAWTISLWLSWLIQDFTCTASMTAGASAPETALFLTLVAMNAALLLLVAVSAFFSLRAFRWGHQRQASLTSFVGLTGMLLAVLFGFGIVLIGVTPFVLEVC